jgi:hypothetical protein
MGLMRLVCAVMAVALTAGCLRDGVIRCGDTYCPEGLVCEAGGCVDPTGLSVPEAPIDFVSVGCGTSAEIDVMLRNFGTMPIAFEASTTIDGVSVMPPGGVVEPDVPFELTIVADASTQSIPGVAAEGSLVIATDREILERTVRLTTAGALIEADETLDFGEIGVGQSMVRSFDIRNVGTSAVDVTLTPPLQTAYSVPMTSASIGAGELVQFNVSYAPQVLGPTSVASIALSYAGALCQVPPAEVVLSGIASGDPILISNTLLDFGSAACGPAASTLPVTLTSNLPQAQTVNAMITGPDANTFMMIPSGTLPAAPSGMLPIAVTRQPNFVPTPVGAKSATLTLTMNPSGVMKVVTLSHDVVAPVLETGIDAVDFGTVPVFSGTAFETYVTNNGNAVANVTVSPAVMQFPGGTQVHVSPSALQVEPGEQAPLIINLITGGQVITNNFMITLSAVGQCAPPSTIFVTFAVGDNL